MKDKYYEVWEHLTNLGHRFKSETCQDLKEAKEWADDLEQSGKKVTIIKCEVIYESEGA